MSKNTVKPSIILPHATLPSYRNAMIVCVRFIFTPYMDNTFHSFTTVYNQKTPTELSMCFFYSFGNTYLTAHQWTGQQGLFLSQKNFYLGLWNLFWSISTQKMWMQGWYGLMFETLCFSYWEVLKFMRCRVVIINVLDLGIFRFIATFFHV